MPYAEPHRQFHDSRRRTQAPDRDRASRRLELVEQEIANIVAAIKQGILTPSTKAELEKAEAERKRLQNAIAVRGNKADNVVRLLPNLKERFEALVANLATVAHQHADKTREVLKSVLGGQIVLHPCADGVERYLTAEVSGNYAGLLRLALGQNKFGGGHPLPALFCPTIRVPLRSNREASGQSAGTDGNLAR